LLKWLSKYVPGATRWKIESDFKDGVKLLQLAQALSGLPYPTIAAPRTKDECHKNVTIALMAILNLFEGLELSITADGKPSIPSSQRARSYCWEDIVGGNADQTRDLLNYLASDEWEAVEDGERSSEEMVEEPETPRKQFDVATFDPRLVQALLSILCHLL
jgi:hypothetical protein